MSQKNTTGFSFDSLEPRKLFSGSILTTVQDLLDHPTPTIKADLNSVKSAKAKLATDQAAIKSVVKTDQAAINAAVKALAPVTDPLKAQLATDTKSFKSKIAQDKTVVTGSIGNGTGYAAATKQLAADQAKMKSVLGKDQSAIDAVLKGDTTLNNATAKLTKDSAPVTSDIKQLNKVSNTLNVDLQKALDLANIGLI